MKSKPVLCFIVATTLAGTAMAGDWPNYGGNNDRTGVTSEQLTLPLGLSWMHQANQLPSPAFTNSVIPLLAPYNVIRTDPVVHDYVFHPVIVGDRLYYSSSTEESVFCLDATSGTNLWSYMANGAMRFAPSVVGGRLYTTSDDGYAYCLNATNGALHWKFRAAPTNYVCVGAQRMTSAWPVWGGVLVTNDTAYLATGLFPTRGCYLYAVNATSGSQIWQRQIWHAPNGQILLHENRLWLPTGRTCPFEYQTSDGAPINSLLTGDTRLGHGGSLLGKVDGLPSWGPCEAHLVWLRISTNTPPGGVNKKVPTGLITALNGWSAVANDDKFVYVRTNQIIALDIAAFRTAVADRIAEIQVSNTTYSIDFDGGGNALPREDAYFRDRLASNTAWTVSVPPADNYRSAILAGNHLFVGAKNKVAAFDTGTGSMLWSNAVDGQAWGLAVANNALYVSTDAGKIYCFKNGAANPTTNAPNFSNPFSTDPVYAEAVNVATARMDRVKGYCLVLGVGNGQLAYELAQRTEFFIVCLDKDSNKVATARANLKQAGVYGSRVVVRHEPSDNPNYPDYFANLVMSDEALTTGSVPYAASSILRMVQPYKGVVVFGSNAGPLDLSAWTGEQLGPWQDVAGSSLTWKVAKRGKRPRAGEWSHGLGNAANTMCSGDNLVSTNLQLQWFGPPDPEDVPDRHDIPTAPLYKNGIAYRSGSNNVTAFDAYNGTVLWKTNLPASLRLLASHNSSPVACVGEQALFGVTSNECWKLDALTGARLATYTGPLTGYDWGYIGTVGNFLIGTSQGTMADKTNSVGLGQVNATFAAWKSRPSVSKDLFAIDLGTDTRQWTYTGGAILNTTIALSQDSVFFAESRNTAGMTNTTGLMEMRDFLALEGTNGARIVALDIATGAPRWTLPVTRELSSPYQWLMRLAHVEGDRLLATRTFYKDISSQWYRVYEFELLDAATGSSLWTNSVVSTMAGESSPLDNTAKNTLAMPPVIANGKIYLSVNFGATDTGMFLRILDLATGALIGGPTNIGTHAKGCTPPTGSQKGLFYRSYSHYLYDFASGKTSDVTRVTRPSCWPSVYAVGGVLLAPESSQECTCGRSYQTSFALAPVFPNGTPPNVAPLGNNTNINVNADTAKSFKLTGTDGDGDELTFETLSVPAHGQISGFNPDTGAITYTPLHAFTGSDSFTFRASDGFTTSGVATVTLNVTMVDTDADGIPDAWESGKNLNPADPNDAGLDSDGDGQTNLQEYYANTNPNDSSSALLIPTVSQQANGHFSLTWKSVGGVRYRLQYSNGDARGGYDGSFTDIVRPLSTELGPGADGAPGTMSFTDDFTLTGGAPPAGARYYRVKAVQ